MDKKRTTEKKEIKYFHEEFPKEEETVMFGSQSTVALADIVV